jgi:predicted Zn-ribbon and HTH transcriptional regulator
MTSPAPLEYICRLCNYVWVARVSRPKACPDCKSRNWDKPPST